MKRNHENENIFAIEADHKNLLSLRPKGYQERSVNSALRIIDRIPYEILIPLALAGVLILGSAYYTSTKVKSVLNNERDKTPSHLEQKTP